MKRQLTTILLTIIAVTAMAIPAKRGFWKTITLVDGTQVRAELRGDEHMHYMQDAQGNKYVDEGDVYTLVSTEELASKARTRRMAKTAHVVKRQLPKKAVSYGNYIGSKKGLIILVNYKDVSFKAGHDAALYKRIANEKGYNEGDFVGSIHDYFLDQSDGLFDLTFDVMGPITLANNRSYYGRNDSQGNDLHAEEMVIEGCKAIKDQVNFEDYDWDGDGEVDQVYVIYAGTGEASGGPKTSVWPHAWELASSSNGILTLNGYKINTYACGNELVDESIDGIGTMCHEFSHCLGFPDFYDIDYSGGWGLYSWDLMDQGSYNGDGFIPAGYSTWERWMAGWRDPIELTSATSVTDMKSLQEGGSGYIIYNPAHRDEYYILENRQLVKWDEGLPGDGMLVLHVDYDQSVWDENKPNDDPKHQRMTWLAADNTLQTDIDPDLGNEYLTWMGLIQDMYPYEANDSITNTSNPAFALYNKNTDGTYFLNKKVTDITRNDDGTMSFNFGDDTTPGSIDDDPSVTPVVPTGDYLFYESFNSCVGTGGNDGIWNGSIASADFVPDMDGWKSDKSHGADQCAKFGTSSADGSATTPEFLVNGTATLTFKAGAWDSSKDGTTLNLSVSSGTISPKSVMMTKGAWGSYTATIAATGNTKITFAAQKGRFFLDEVLAVDPTATGIKGISITERPADNRIYSIDGRYVGNDLNILRPGIYIVGGRKVVR